MSYRPKGETTHYDLCVASAPSNHVRCASLRSGGRRLAVRTSMEHHIGALPRTPFPASRDFPSRENEKIGGTGYCVTYDTDSQSRNADFILIALRAIPQPSGPKAPSNLRTLGPQGPIHFKNLFSATLLYKLPASAGHNLRATGPSTL